jgi:hypothetical protein
MKFELNLFQNNIADLKDYPKFGSQEFIDIIMLQQNRLLLKKLKCYFTFK